MIMTPSHWKAIHAIESAKAGKDVYCEKPMTLCIREGREMVNAVRRYGRIFQHGTQQRSHWNFHFACEMVRNERIGTLKSVYVIVGGPPRDCYLPAEPLPKGVNWDMWLGPAPWRPFNSSICMTGCHGWDGYQDYGGGGMTDWGVHHFDIVQWAMGMDDSGPVEIIPPNGEDANLLTYRYANGVNVCHICRASDYKIIFEGSDGRIEVSSSRLRTWPEHLMREPTRSDEIHLPRTWPTASTNAHIANFLHAVRTRERPICDVEIGCRSTTICHLGNIAYMLKRPLQWDPVTERFTNDAQANRLLDRPRRAPWTLYL